MKNIGKKLAAVALAIAASSAPAVAGRGGGADAINAAIQSNSTDAIIAEVERAEGLVCGDCVQSVASLLTDSRYEIREVASWWFGKRIGLRNQMIVTMKANLAGSDSNSVRNAADFLGTLRQYDTLPAMQTAFVKVNSDAKLAIVRAVKRFGTVKGNAVLQTAMADSDPAVRAAAVAAWREVSNQLSAQPVEPLLTDTDAGVRAQAAAVVGALRDGAAVSVLNAMVVNDADSQVRHNAAWALGRIGAQSSRQALTAASQDPSGFVSGVAKSALASLH